MLKSFFHTGFVVKDLEKSVDFYTNVLGLQLALRMERQGEFINQVLDFPDAHIKGAMVDKGEGHQLELIQYLNPASGPGGISRKERGLRFNNPPASLSDDHGHMLRKAMYAQDPDGNWLEFVELF